jgi:hypothetical protein
MREFKEKQPIRAWTLDSRTTVTPIGDKLFEFRQKDQVVILSEYQLQVILNRSLNL